MYQKKNISKVILPRVQRVQSFFFFFFFFDILFPYPFYLMDQSEKVCVIISRVHCKEKNVLCFSVPRG